tara:strand:- start:1202 stop:1420 length:219 start_codon:yes stop_codon:yes gene_type:complete
LPLGGGLPIACACPGGPRPGEPRPGITAEGGGKPRGGGLFCPAPGNPPLAGGGEDGGGIPPGIGGPFGACIP